VEEERLNSGCRNSDLYHASAENFVKYASRQTDRLTNMRRLLFPINVSVVRKMAYFGNEGNEISCTKHLFLSNYSVTLLVD